MKNRTLEIIFKAGRYEKYRVQICAYFGLQYLFQRELEASHNSLNPKGHIPVYVNISVNLPWFFTGPVFNFSLFTV